jgi:ribosomal protein L30E
LLSANCPARVEKDINYYAGMGNAEMQKLDYANDELGVICKKPFSISVLAFLKSAGK